MVINFLPVVAEDGVVQNNLLEELNELVGEIGRHESLHGDGDVFGILGFRQCCLYHLNKLHCTSVKRSCCRELFQMHFATSASLSFYLVNKLSFVLILITKHMSPKIRVPPLDEIPGFTLEQ